MEFHIGKAKKNCNIQIDIAIALWAFCNTFQSISIFTIGNNLPYRYSQRPKNELLLMRVFCVQPIFTICIYKCFANIFLHYKRKIVKIYATKSIENMCCWWAMECGWKRKNGWNAMINYSNLPIQLKIEHPAVNGVCQRHSVHPIGLDVLSLILMNKIRSESFSLFHKRHSIYSMASMNFNIHPALYIECTRILLMILLCSSLWFRVYWGSQIH